MSRSQPRRLADFGELKPAEAKLLAELDSGQLCVIGREVPPEDPPGDVVIRASFPRWCILRGPEEEDTPVRLHEKGVQLRGAYILGDGPRPESIEFTSGLDLEGCAVRGDINLWFCRFPDNVWMLGASLATLNLQDSHIMAGLDADRLRTTGGVFLRQVEVTGHTDLLGARIGADLDCTGGRFENTGGGALDIAGAEVAGAFFWRDGASIDGVLDLAEAKIRDISDDPKCWPKRKGDLILNGCTYGAFSGPKATNDARARLRWLALQDPTRWGQDFWPQPYEQLAKVLREAGHEADARTVLIEKERLQRAARRDRVYKSDANLGPILWLLYRIWDGCLGGTVRYGRQPFLAVVWLLGFWALGTAWFQTAANHGAIKPNTAFVLRAPEWVGCADDGERRADQPSQYACFIEQPEAKSYPRFNAAIYSADTLLPIVALEMQEFWIPDETTDFGWWARVWLWVQIGMGWALSLLAVAGFSGLMRSDAGK